VRAATKKPSNRLQPAEGVVPTPSQEQNMPSIAQPTDTVEHLPWCDTTACSEDRGSSGTLFDVQHLSQPGLWRSVPADREHVMVVGRVSVAENYDGTASERYFEPGVWFDFSGTALLTPDDMDRLAAWLTANAEVARQRLAMIPGGAA
jgi:hypothetical protein